jgi:transcription antitermination factor NusG
LFVRCCLGERLDDIRYANGVSSLVHFGQRIPVMPDAVLEELRQCFVEAEEPISVEDRLFPGAEVTFVEGAFLGFSGIVVRLLPARRRVQILLEFLGRTTIAEVDRTALMTESSVADLVPALSLSAEISVAAVG